MPFPVTVLGDDTAELAETVVVELSNPAGVMLGDARATGTIANDDYGVSVADAAGGGRGSDGHRRHRPLHRLPARGGSRPR